MTQNQFDLNNTLEKRCMSLNRAKILATLGPASSTDEMVEQLVIAGMNVARINLSHADHDTHRASIQRVRRAAEKLKVSVGVLADLQGPKLRVGQFENDEPIILAEGASITLKATEERGNPELITTPSYPLLEALAINDLILINDGALRLRMSHRIDEHTVTCQVIQGGRLSERKGINVPETNLSFSALTEKDKKDTLFALEMGVDFIALSFVRTADDIRDLKQFIQEHGYECPPIIAKIEKPKALSHIEEILEEVYGLMVARGDLGVEISAERVPVIQKQLIEKAAKAEKPIIVATQMLESMIHSAVPSRAEVSDVANAVFDGADALMLSAESAAGQYPVEAVSTMRRVITESEKHYTQHNHLPHEPSSVYSPLFHHTVAHAASYAAIKSNVKAIVVMSTSGSMAQRVSKLKPLRPIIALTESAVTYNRMSLLWGVTPLIIEFGETTEEVLNRGEDEILKHQLLHTGDEVLFCAGKTPIIGTTNMLKFLTLGESIKSSIGILR